MKALQKISYSYFQKEKVKIKLLDSIIRILTRKKNKALNLCGHIHKDGSSGLILPNSNNSDAACQICGYKFTSTEFATDDHIEQLVRDLKDCLQMLKYVYAGEDFDRGTKEHHAEIETIATLLTLLDEVPDIHNKAKVMIYGELIKLKRKT